MGKYFDKFGLVNYSGQIARNLLTKVDLSMKSKEEVNAKFDYQIDSNITRPDNLSYIVYDNPMYDWIIYLTNTIIDPYHDLYLTDEQLIEKIKAKYQSQANARKFILYYRNNWAEDDSKISVADYESLSTEIKKYWEPVLDVNNRIVEYKRAEIDWVRSTNKILELTVEDTSFVVESGYTTQGSASANIIDVDPVNKIVQVNHVEGTFTLGPWGSTNITAIQEIVNNIPDEEAGYWSRVNAWDEEVEENELRRYIALLRKNYIPDFENKFKEKIK